METLIICIFIVLLIGCLLSGLSVIAALAAGFVLFFGYGILTGHSPARHAGEMTAPGEEEAKT